MPIVHISIEYSNRIAYSDSVTAGSTRTKSFNSPKAKNATTNESAFFKRDGCGDLYNEIDEKIKNINDAPCNRYERRSAAIIGTFVF